MHRNIRLIIPGSTAYADHDPSVERRRAWHSRSRAAWGIGVYVKRIFRISLVPQEICNIIHRKAVEAALFIEQERSKVILNSTGEAVISTDLLENVTDANAAFESMTGWQKELVCGHPFAEIAPLIYSGNREPV